MGLTAKKVYAILNGKIKEISGDVSSLGTPLFYAGSVETADLLPTSPSIGAVYNIIQESIYGEPGTNVAWNGVLWNVLGSTFDLSLLLTKEEAQELYLSQNQGIENTGKILVVGDSGKIELGDAPSGNTNPIETDETLTKSGYAADAKVTGEAIDYLHRTKAPGIVETASGSLIELKDASDLPMQGLTVYGKSTQRTTTGAQMIDVKNLRAINAVLNYSPDGKTITLEGSKAYCSAEYKIPTNIVEQLCGKNIYIKYKASIDSGSNIHIRIDKNDGTETYVRGESILIPEDTKNIIVRVMCNDSSVDLQNPKKVTFTDAMISLSPIAEWEPYTGGLPAPNPNYPQEIENVGEEVGISCIGRNLFNYKDLIDNEVTIKNEDDGRTIIITGSKPFAQAYQVFPEYIIALCRGKTMYLHAAIKQNGSIPSFHLVVTDSYGKTEWLSIPPGKTDSVVNISNDAVKMHVELVVNNTEDPLPNNVVTIFQNAMISLLSSDEWEPHKSNRQIITTPNGLLGIPVTSGGNYTDPDGQQWVCDTIEWNRASGQKEYVKRVNNWLINRVPENISLDVREQTQEMHITLPADSWSYVNMKTRELLSDKFRYTSLDTWGRDELGIMGFGGSGKNKLTVRVPVDADSQYFVNNPANVLYILAEPIRNPLTEDQIKALESLRTFHPTSIVSNDAGADMQVIYAADTKAYIDSKIDALSKTILDAVGGK